MKTVLHIILPVILFSLNACKTIPTHDDSSKQAAESNDKINTSHNSMNSLDWEGVYSGTLPCADCEGIQTIIKLQKDHSYIIQSKYLGKSDSVFESKGTFSWNKEGSIITLENIDSDKTPSMYQVGENTLALLDLNRNKISGELADNYILIKIYPGLAEKYWKLIEINGNLIPTEVKFNKEPHMILKSEGNRVNGNGGCNSFSGKYKVKKGNRISFSQVASTKMACPDMETETEFFIVLNTTDNYIINGDTLILNKARMAPLARFEAVYLK